MDSELADAIAREVGAHPSVVRLDGGPVGTLATHLPGRRIAGVRVAGPGEPVDVGVVLRLGERLPEVTGELRELVRGVAGEVAVNIEVTDVVAPSTADGTAATPR
ncbi:hypothetical protein [Prauserella muralis]|uniref:Uncharacterized protein n=1 Tax=Prauserella muralis TaxID=588067 RepID=A0A2V4B231_9PSEU|nr:hypothetical protein [Prauserella muralis]PXY28206.1 hypothetical protein BAY60_17930 [Prauserella muralis]TWE21977.1 hypothetical protein FHX69_3209 [Prauserella muralis]